MTIAPARMAVAAFALRAVARPGKGDWLVLVVPEEAVGEIASRVAGEIEGLGGCWAENIKDPADARELAQTVHDAERETVLVVSGLDRFLEEEWRHADLLRSRCVRDKTIVLVISPRSAEKLARGAPNLASWIGGSLWEADLGAESLSDDERSMRLRSLREWSGLTDDEVVRRAREGTLPDDPEFAEWLVLLGRVDLLGA